jgi:hypothetical protein
MAEISWLTPPDDWPGPLDAERQVVAVCQGAVVRGVLRQDEMGWEVIPQRGRRVRLVDCSAWRRV